MQMRIYPSRTTGSIKAIASKSAAHRLLICAAFSDAPAELLCEEINEDIEATARCLRALGAGVERKGAIFSVTPIAEPVQRAVLDCGESGSTLRFLLPIVCALGVEAELVMAGRLPERPLSPLREILEENGITLSASGTSSLTVRGRLTATDFTICGNVSSQFISGLLFALAVSQKSGCVRIDGSLESAPYVDMTVDALRRFGVTVEREENRFSLRGNRLCSPERICVEGDWSNAAFWLALGAIGEKPITVTGLDTESHQGDRAVCSLLRRFGAKVSVHADGVTVAPAPLHGIDIDARQIPDLVPILSTVAALSDGKTEIYGAARLRIKESDRLQAVATMLGALGARVCEREDGLVIEGVSSLSGGSVSSFGDHRIAMSAAVAACVCRDCVTVDRAEAVAKSYPDFWKHLALLGAKTEE